MASVAETAQASTYFVKNTFLSTLPDAPKSTFFRMQTCPGSISNEPTKDSLSAVDLEEIDAPELDDTCSNASDVSLSDAACLGQETKWQRMQTEEHCWGQVETQVTAAANTSLVPDCSTSTTALDSRCLLGAYSEPEGGGYAAPMGEGGCGLAPVMMPMIYPVAPYAGDLGDFHGKTTVMMRNLPNKYTRSLLLEELGRTGFHGAYDFIYVPMDDNTRANKGYAFINFVAPAYAKSFKETYEDCTMPLFNSSKSIQVSIASLQGFEANYAHYVNARCNKGDPTSRPLFLRECDELVKPWGRRRPIKLMQNRAGESKENAPAAGGVKFCPSCGTGGQLGHRFCSECGHSMQ